VITGSSNFLLRKNIADSLTGRVGILRLLPFSFSEIPDHLKEASVFNGAYPRVVMAEYKNSYEWYSSYLDTYIEKDLREISNIGNLHEFKVFIKLLAVRVGQLLNLAELGRETGTSIPTMKRWISILEESFLIFLSYPFSRSINQRLIKSPKIYFYDTGLVTSILGIINQEHYENNYLFGNIFENYLISEIIKKENNQGNRIEPYFIRTSNDTEIDLVLEQGLNKQLIEIKTTSTFKTKFITNLERFLSPGDNGFLLYQGEDYPVKNNILALNYQNFLSSNIKKNLDLAHKASMNKANFFTDRKFKKLGEWWILGEFCLLYKKDFHYALPQESPDFKIYNANYHFLTYLEVTQATDHFNRPKNVSSQDTKLKEELIDLIQNLIFKKIEKAKDNYSKNSLKNTILVIYCTLFSAIVFDFYSDLVSKISIPDNNVFSEIWALTGDGKEIHQFSEP
jgi:hypothetical protein